MMCEIHPRHQAEFDRRLQLIQPAFNRIKKMLCRTVIVKPLVYSQMYISGECAAWLVGLADKFKVIEIFTDGYKKHDFFFDQDLPKGWQHFINDHYVYSDQYTSACCTSLKFNTDGSNNQPPVKLIFSDIQFSK